jgi:hypothetical protein
MDHAEVRAWLEEAALEPGALEQPADPQVVGHLERCRACAAERDALRATAVALDLAIGPPIAARERVLANVRELGRERSAAPAANVVAPAAGTAATREPAARTTLAGWLGRLTPRMAVAMIGLALVLLAVGALGGALGGALLRGDEPRRLDMAVAEMTRLAAQPGASQLALRDPEGNPAGMVIHDPATARLAVISASLPGGDTDYWCYLERAGERTRIGPMHLEGETHYWAGPMGGPADAGRSGDRFLVLDERSDGAPVLVGEF